MDGKFKSIGDVIMINKRMKSQFESYIEGKTVDEGLVYQFLKEYYTSPKLNSIYMYASNKYYEI